MEHPDSQRDSEKNRSAIRKLSLSEAKRSNPGSVWFTAEGGIGVDRQVGPVGPDRPAVGFWLGFWFWLGHLGAALGRFFASLAVVGAWLGGPPTKWGVVGGGNPKK
jgi:hypothetical protein